MRARVEGGPALVDGRRQCAHLGAGQEQHLGRLRGRQVDVGAGVRADVAVPDRVVEHHLEHEESVADGPRLAAQFLDRAHEPVGIGVGDGADPSASERRAARAPPGGPDTPRRSSACADGRSTPARRRRLRRSEPKPARAGSGCPAGATTRRQRRRPLRPACAGTRPWSAGCRQRRGSGPRSRSACRPLSAGLPVVDGTDGRHGSSLIVAPRPRRWARCSPLTAAFRR